jgi:hypothetical protein
MMAKTCYQRRALLSLCVLQGSSTASAQSRENKCNDLIMDVSDAINSVCCDGSCESSGGGGWNFPSTCSPACAHVFMPFFSECASEIFAEDRAKAGDTVGKKALQFERKCAAAIGRSTDAKMIDSSVVAAQVDVQSFALTGSALVDGPVLQLTQAVGGQEGTAFVPVAGLSTSNSFSVSYMLYVGDGSGADGSCMNLGANSLGGRTGEDGVAEGLSLCFDEWANGDSGDHGIAIFYNGAAVFDGRAQCGNRAGCPPVSFFEDSTWHAVELSLSTRTDGGAYVAFTLDDAVYGGSGSISSFALPKPLYLGFTGRTGGAYNNHWVKAISTRVGGSTCAALSCAACNGDCGWCASNGGFCSEDCVTTPEVCQMPRGPFYEAASHKALYLFDGNANDSAGTAHGTVEGATLTADRFGTANSAYLFDGSAAFISTPTPFGAGDEDFSIAIWLSPVLVGDASWHGFCGYQADSTRSPSLWVNWNGGDDATTDDGGMAWDSRTTQDGSGERFAGVVKSMFAANVYVHVVWTATAGESNRFYKNGAVAPDGGTVPAASSVDLHDSYTIGKVDNYFSGNIDAVAFYDFAVARRDVSALYTATVARAQAVTKDYDSCGELGTSCYSCAGTYGGQQCGWCSGGGTGGGGSCSSECVTAPGECAAVNQYDPVLSRLQQRGYLVGYWSLDGNGLDHSDNHLDAAATDAEWAVGVNNLAFRLDGMDALVVPNNKALDLQRVTMVSWIRPTSYSQDRSAGNAGAPRLVVMNKESSYEFGLESDSGALQGALSACWRWWGTIRVPLHQWTNVSVRARPSVFPVLTSDLLGSPIDQTELNYVSEPRWQLRTMVRAKCTTSAGSWPSRPSAAARGVA